jgi:ribosomal protein S18 acetylase RimI-like enzyme
LPLTAGRNQPPFTIGLISMTPAGIASLLHKRPSIRLLDHLPANLADGAAALYLSALADKLVPVYGGGPRARQALARGFNRRLCITAVDNDRLVGVLGIQTPLAGFMDATFKTLRPHYGIPGSLWRLALLAFLQYSPPAGEAYVDGIAVDPDYRGQGVGTAMIAALESRAAGQGLSMVRLEVVGTNSRAQKFYRRLGFEIFREQTVWPVGSLAGFRSSVVMIKPLC